MPHMCTVAADPYQPARHPVSSERRATSPAHFDLLMDITRQGRFRPVIAKTYPLDQASPAQEKLSRRQHIGKLVMHPQTVDAHPWGSMFAWILGELHKHSR